MQGFPLPSLPPLQRKLRFACLGVLQATWCPAYKKNLSLKALKPVFSAQPLLKYCQYHPSSGFSGTVKISLSINAIRGELTRQKHVRDVFYAKKQKIAKVHISLE